MSKQTTTVEHPWTGVKIRVPKVSKGVLYVCRDRRCGKTITDEKTADINRSYYKDRVDCPACFITMSKVIK